MQGPKKDVAWKYCERIKDGSRVHVKCNYCGKMLKGGGIFRFKEHLAGRKGGGPMCQLVPPDVRDLMEQILSSSVESPASVSKKINNVINNVPVNYASEVHGMAGITPNEFEDVENSTRPGKRRKKDVAWEHCQSVDSDKRVQIKCNYCGKEFKGGGIFRFKEHLAGRKGSAPVCAKVPPSVREQMQQILDEISGEPIKRVRKNVNVDYASRGDMQLFSSQLDEASMERNGGQAYNLGARNLNSLEYLEEGIGGVDVDITEDERVNLSTLVCGLGSASKTLTPCTDNAIQIVMGRFLYDIGAGADALDSGHFQLLMDLAASRGSKLVAPSSHYLRGSMLQKLVEEAKKDIADHQVVWAKTGCSILIEEWKEENGRFFLNILVNCSRGTVFLKSVDASDAVQSDLDLCEVLKQVVEEVGVGNVLQVITNSDKVYACSGERLMETFPTLYWAPCSAHCIDLILEDFGKLEWVSAVIEQAKSVTRFIYNHSAVLNLMRKFTFGNDVVQQGSSRAATSFITLKRMADFKLNLQTMVTSQEWTDTPYAEQLGGLAILDIITNRSFWSSCITIIRLTGPLLRVLETVTSEKSAALGNVFSGIYRAKEAIKKELVKREDYVIYWDIIDHRWEQLWKCPLQTAGFFLNPKFFYGVEEGLCNELLSRVYDCIEKLIPDTEVQDKIVKELNLYKNATGDFGRKMAIRARETLPPAEWWSTYGGGCSNLARMAVRILNQTCCLNRSKPNHIAFNKVYDAKNRLERQRFCNLVFVQYNLWLKRRKRVPLDPISFEDTINAEDWTMQNDLCLDDEGNLDWMSLFPSSLQPTQLATSLNAPSAEEAEDLAAGFNDSEILYKPDEERLGRQQEQDSSTALF